MKYYYIFCIITTAVKPFDVVAFPQRGSMDYDAEIPDDYYKYEELMAKGEITTRVYKIGGGMMSSKSMSSANLPSSLPTCRPTFQPSGVPTTAIPTLQPSIDQSPNTSADNQPVKTPVYQPSGGMMGSSSTYSRPYPTKYPSSGMMSVGSMGGYGYYPTATSTDSSGNNGGMMSTSKYDSSTMPPTDRPTYFPTDMPTYYPTYYPTYEPTDMPTYLPTNRYYYPSRGGKGKGFPGYYDDDFLPQYGKKGQVESPYSSGKKYYDGKKGGKKNYSSEVPSFNPTEQPSTHPTYVPSNFPSMKPSLLLPDVVGGMMGGSGSMMSGGYASGGMMGSGGYGTMGGSMSRYYHRDDNYNHGEYDYRDVRR